MLAIQKEIRNLENKEKAILLQKFFKTGKGEYAYGDIFLGIRVPETRKIVNKYKDLSLYELKILIKSEYHEERLAALLILVKQSQKASEDSLKKINELYLSNTKYINNWDLVDLSAEHIVGKYLFTNRGTVPLRGQSPVTVATRKGTDPFLKEGLSPLITQKLAKSDFLWDRRIAMLSSFYFIKKNEPQIAFDIADILINDSHDLIQKAVGWMLREIGKRCSQELEEEFLKKYYKTMPRTMLRYAIEKFEEDKRQKYLKNEI